MAQEHPHLWSFIQRHTKERPEAIACSKDNKTLTYGQVESSSLSLAVLFASQGIVAGDAVPIFVARNFESVVSIIALLRLGVCFVPIDGESWSQSRIDSVLRAVEPKIVVIAQETNLKANETQSISFEEIKDVVGGKSTNEATALSMGIIDCNRNPEEVVYMIFTSGTTGTPKGVVISRASVENYVSQGRNDGMPFNLGVQNNDKVLLLFSLAFDAAWGVFFSTLCHGAHLVLSEPRAVLEDAKRCTILPATPSLLATLGDPAQYKNVKYVFLGGESPSPRVLQDWWSEERSIYNCYGPTEATICASMAELRPNHPITLGEPMSNTRLLILNDELEVCDEGELHISGPGLAIGFYKNETLTSERFFDWKGLRIFATRDRARRTSEGIVFCGRSDSIVKNRGYLINLETDVIPSLESCVTVHSAAAFMHEGKLVGVVTPQTVDAVDVRRQLSEKHDEFVVPDQILAYDELCLTSNGKIDTKALQRNFISRQLQSFNAEPTEALAGPCSIIQEAVAETLCLSADTVPMNCSFWELGGNSLLAIKLMSTLHQRGVSLRFHDIFTSTTLSALYGRVKPADPFNLPGTLAPTADERLLPAPITTTQMGMIRSSVRKSAMSYMVVIIDLPWKTETGYSDRVRVAWETVMKRHTIFSTYFDMNTGEQKMEAEYHHDWEEHTTADQAISVAVTNESNRLFENTQRNVTDNLYRPLNSFRMIVNGSATKANLLWLVHHTRVDGWSMGLIMQEVQHLLHGEILSSDPFQFLQIARELPWHVSPSRAEARKFWCEALSKVTEATPLTLPKPREQTKHTRLGETGVTVNLEIGKIERICRSLGVSSASVIYTAWALLLKAYTAQDQVVFGTVVSGRHLHLPGIETAIGPLINSCPLPVCMSGLRNKSCLLKYVQDLVLQVSSQQWFATEALQEAAPSTQSQAFQTMLFLEYDLPEFPNQDKWRFSRRDVPEFGLTTIIRRGNGGLEINALFDENLYTQPVIKRMMSHFRNLFLALLDPACEKILSVRERMLDPCEALSLISASSDLKSPYMGPSNLKERFEKGVDQWPYETAIESGTRKMSYQDLDSQANGVAKAVLAQVPPRSAVGIVSDRSLEWLVAVIGVIKAGAIYVPLDTKLPLQRIQVMMKTASVELCIFPNEAYFAQYGDALGETKSLCLELQASTQMCTRSELMPNAEDVAYITFTSGSTGAPKGVRIKHESVVSYLSYGPARMDARPGRRHAQMFSPGFDVNQAEIFGTLCYGATLVLADPVDPFAHLTRVNATMITPSFLSVCEPDQYPDIDTILFAGEAVPQALADKWAGTRTVYNSYGPCECTIGCLFESLKPMKEVTLGNAIPRVGVYLLDSQSQPVPIGVPGEICLSGIQIAEGYIGTDRQGLSQERFVPDPFLAGQRMYRTGDCAVWTEQLEPKFIGRFDNQVKVRGHRVELTEIENVIQMVDSTVQRAAAIVHSDNIVAYVEPDTVDVANIQAKLRTKLPRYACPSAIVVLPSLPVMPNQKLDRKALVSISHHTQNEETQPLTQTQALVAEGWREAIGLHDDVPINATSDFLELGGSSLSQIKLAQIVSRKLRFKLPLKLFIWTTDLSGLSDAIEDWLTSTEKQSQLPFIVAWKSIKPPFNTVSESEAEFVRLSLDYPPQTFNVGYKITLTGGVDVENLVKSVVDVTSHEPVLKSRFYVLDDEVRRGQSSSACEVTQLEAPNLDLEAFTNRPFDLSTGPLTRINVSPSSSGAEILLLQHHAVTDKAAIQLLLGKIKAQYLRNSNGYTEANDASHLTHLPDYAVWAQWKAGQPLVGMNDPNAVFWHTQLSEMPAQLFTRQVSKFVGKSTSFSWKTNGRVDGSMELYLALTAVTLAQCQETNDMILGIPHVDRTEPATESMLGVFLNRLPVRLNVKSTALDSFSNLVDLARISVRDALAHAISFKTIRDITNLDEIFQVMVVYNQRNDSVGASLCMPGVSVQETPLKPTGAKFPLLIEFTETQDRTICEFEFMENMVSPATADHIREQMEETVRLLGDWFGAST
ncbi:unnamed protein product [Penicillium salamii]|nr:unnamed protein product [Penicillium salamii]